MAEAEFHGQAQHEHCACNPTSPRQLCGGAWGAGKQQQSVQSTCRVLGSSVGVQGVQPSGSRACQASAAPLHSWELAGRSQAEAERAKQLPLCCCLAAPHALPQSCQGRGSCLARSAAACCTPRTPTELPRVRQQDILDANLSDFLFHHSTPQLLLIRASSTGY